MTPGVLEAVSGTIGFLLIFGGILVLLIAAIIFGALLIDFSWLNLLKALIAIAAQLLTAAVSTMALARAGYLTGALPVAETSPNDLEDERQEADPS